jgi:predicted metal-dependent hydrolase
MLDRKTENDKREEARRIITNIVDAICSDHGYKYNRIAIKNQRTRLGSCSSKKNLNFNWQIIKLPDVIRDYVIKHEIAHLVHLNHGRDFWNELKKLDPYYKEHHRWIRKNVQKYLVFS